MSRFLKITIGTQVQLIAVDGILNINTEAGRPGHPDITNIFYRGGDMIALSHAAAAAGEKTVLDTLTAAIEVCLLDYNIITPLTLPQSITASEPKRMT
tara:strand:- start:310 stop:603 length:294 start_codon:yes stop_codon:yes gene_type:complete